MQCSPGTDGDLVNATHAKIVLRNSPMDELAKPLRMRTLTVYPEGRARQAHGAVQSHIKLNR
jgi:hypothetical protein